MTIDEMEQQLKADFFGYHVEIQLHSNGGALFVNGCVSCGTDENVSNSAAWSTEHGGSLEQAVFLLKKEMGLNNARLH
jgi:hypothetical protein